MIVDPPRQPITVDPLIEEAKRRTRRRRLILGVVLVGALAVALLSYERLDRGPVSAPTAAVQAATVLNNARAQHSVHYTSHLAVGCCGLELRASGDVATGRGMLRLAKREGSLYPKEKHWFRVTVVVIGRTAYVGGSASALRSWLDLSPSEASRYAGRWISIRPGSRLHGELAEGGTLDSFLRLITPPGRLGTFTYVEKGRRFVSVVGTRDGIGHYLDAPSSSLLPTSADTDTHGAAWGVRISRWNEPVHVSAPAHAIPIAVVRRSDRHRAK